MRRISTKEILSFIRKTFLCNKSLMLYMIIDTHVIQEIRLLVSSDMNLSYDLY